MRCELANSKGPDTIRDLARDIGATAVSKEEAVQGVEAIVLAIPFGKYPDLASLFNDVPADVVVIDTSNYYPFRDGAVAEVDGGKPESVWVSEQIGRPVVKAWNAVLAVTLAERGQPNRASGRIAIPVAGDAPKAKATAMQLVEATGFDTVDAGSLRGLPAPTAWHACLLHGVEGERVELGAAVSRAVSRARQSRRPPQDGGRREAVPRRNRRSEPDGDCMITDNIAGGLTSVHAVARA